MRVIQRIQKTRRGKETHGKVRTTHPLWVACGVRQLLMRMPSAQSRPLPHRLWKKERRQ